MNHLGIATIIIFSIILFFSWRIFKKGKIEQALIGIVLAGLLLRIFVISDPVLHDWDERFHALVAKNMIENPLKPTLYKNPILPYDYKDWTSNHIWVHKQPVPLWCMALSLKLFGINEIALRLPSLIISTIGIFLMYWIGKNLFDQQVGFFSSFLFSIHGLILELTGGRAATDHIDVYFLFFILAGICFSIKFAKSKKQIDNIFCGIAIGLAILTKWLPALIVIPFWFFILRSNQFGQYSYRKIFYHFFILILTVTIISLPWQIYIQVYFPLEAQWERQYNMLHVFSSLADKSVPFYYHFNHMRVIYGELVYLPIFWILYKTFFKKRDHVYKGILIWLFIPYLFFSVVITKMQAYTLFAGPAIFLDCGLFWRMLKIHKHKFKYKIVPQIILLGLVVLPLRYSFERIKPFEKNQKDLTWKKELQELKKFEGNEKLVFFNVERHLATMFYIDCIAYGHTPSHEKIEELKAQGYKVIVRD